MPSTERNDGAGVTNAVAAAAGQRATELLRQTTMRCGGCGAKVGATTLTQAAPGRMMKGFFFGCWGGGFDVFGDL